MREKNKIKLRKRNYVNDSQNSVTNTHKNVNTCQESEQIYIYLNVRERAHLRQEQQTSTVAQEAS